eukprot:COSAG06_NODE_1126_length_10609_cov_228.247383_16_plen_87_part_00
MLAPSSMAGRSPPPPSCGAFLRRNCFTAYLCAASCILNSGQVGQGAWEAATQRPRHARVSASTSSEAVAAEALAARRWRSGGVQCT